MWIYNSIIFHRLKPIQNKSKPTKWINDKKKNEYQHLFQSIYDVHDDHEPMYKHLANK